MYCTKDALINFDLGKLYNEWKERAPLFYSFLLILVERVRNLQFGFQVW